MPIDIFSLIIQRVKFKRVFPSLLARFLTDRFMHFKHYFHQFLMFYNNGFGVKHDFFFFK